jgi:hypothetical protein
MAMGIGFVFVKLSTLVAMKQSEEAVTGSLRDMDGGAYISELARIQKLTWAPPRTDAPALRLATQSSLSADEQTSDGRQCPARRAGE